MVNAVEDVGVSVYSVYRELWVTQDRVIRTGL